MNLRWLHAAAMCGLMSLAAEPAPAQDNCFDYCAQSCPTDSTRSECTDNCVLRCGPGGDLENSWSSPLPPYGAIAYGKDSGAFGYAYNQESRSAAEQMAMSNCAQNGNDCKIVIDLAHACGAVAAVIGGVVSVGTGSSQDEAQNVALSSCRSSAGDSCQIQVWTCSP